MSETKGHPSGISRSRVRSQSEHDAALHAIVGAVAMSHSKYDEDDVRAVLSMALQGAGIPSPAPQWVDHTAQAIATGQLVSLRPRR